jgi:hypothetical protein
LIWPIYVIKIEYCLEIVKILLGLICDILLVIVFAIPALFLKKTIKTEIEKPLIILIHGSGSSSFQWGVAEIYLWLNNYQYLSVDYNSKQNITKSTWDIIEKIKLFDSKHKDIILIDHSQGGLIARDIYNHKDFKNYANPKKIFILNSPQLGCHLANKRNTIFKRFNIKLTLIIFILVGLDIIILR